MGFFRLLASAGIAIRSNQVGAFLGIERNVHPVLFPMRLAAWSPKQLKAT